MTIRKTGTWFFLLMFVFSLTFLSAQEESPGENEEDGPAIESDWSIFDAPSYESGDQMFGVGLGLVFPVLFSGGNGEKIEHNLSLGGTLLLSFDYFLLPSLSVGIEANGSFNASIGENMLFMGLFGLRVTYQFVFHPIEIPITVAVGLAPQGYLDQNYLGLYVKPSLGVFWRFNADWSFGIHGNWWWLPEWTEDASKTVNGNFVTLSIAARYHF